MRESGGKEKPGEGELDEDYRGTETERKFNKRN